LSKFSVSRIKTATRAFGAFTQGWENGDFQEFLEMLTNEFTFSYPYGKYRGKFTGLAGKAQIVAKCLEHSASGDRLRFNPPHHITSNDRTVMFEFECEGIIDGEKYQGRIAIALDVSNDKICGFREYFGDVDW
jgi:ketosteroid isomerase-like protein